MIKKLLSIRLRALFLGSLSGKDKKGNFKPVSPGKIVLFTLLYAFLVLTFAGLAFMMSMSMAVLLVPADASDIYFGVFAVVCFTILFIMSIFETKSELFECKDNELLMALPISSRDIVVSRIFSVLTLNYAVTAILFIPVIMSYGLCGGEPIGMFGGAYLVLVIPLLATALASGVGYIVAQISKRIKSKTLISVIATLAFLAIYFVVYYVFIAGFESLMEGDEQMVGQMLESLKPFGAIGSAALFSPLPLLILTAATALSVIISLYVISKKYRSIITATHSAAVKKYVARDYEKSSKLVALSKKEIGRFFSSANYILNAGLGVVFAVLLTVFMAFSSGSLFEMGEISLDGELFFNAKDFIAPIGVAIVIFFFSMNTVSSSALSLEGENLAVLKSLPLEAKDILLAKTVPHIIVNAPISSLCGLVLAISFNVPPIYYLFYIVTPFAVNVLFAFVGLLLNVAFPKFVFTNEVEVIKQSLAIFLSMLIFMLIAIAISMVSLLSALFDFGVLAHGIILLLVLVLDFGAYLIITGPASRRFTKLSV